MPHVPLKPHHMKTHITPSEDLFMLAHLGIPKVDLSRWRLDVSGLVQKPGKFSLKDLKSLPKVEVESVHECAGNPLEPRTPKRRVANVVWGGALLSEILAIVGTQDGASFVWSFGADHGTFKGTTVQEYGKDLPMERVDTGDVLIAYELNGEPVPGQFGAPARLFIPGFYGTNSVKWLTRIELADRRYEGLFTTRYYNDQISGKGDNRTTPVWKIAPEAVISTPSPNQSVSGPVGILGWAWGYEEIAAVDISADQGRTWHAARLAPRKQWSWQPFEYVWTPSRPGPVTLICRATDAKGETQPKSGARNEMHSVVINVIEVAWSKSRAD